MAEKEEEENSGISITKETPDETHLERPKGTDAKSVIKNIILDIEEQSQMFSREEIIEKAKKKNISESEANAVIDDLIAENYLHKVTGTNMLARTAWRDYSPAFEEFPEY